MNKLIITFAITILSCTKQKNIELSSLLIKLAESSVVQKNPVVTINGKPIINTKGKKVKWVIQKFKNDSIVVDAILVSPDLGFDFGEYCRSVNLPCDIMLCGEDNSSVNSTFQYTAVLNGHRFYLKYSTGCGSAGCSCKIVLYLAGIKGKPAGFVPCK